MDGRTEAAQVSRKARTLAITLIAALTPGILSAHALAEPKPVDPYYVIVASDKAPLVCMPNDSAYTVADVKPGTVLKVDADDARWARVEYPAGAKAFVRADDGKVEDGKLRLTNATKLFARNEVKGGSGSWKAVFDVELPVGTLLSLADPATEKQGELVIGYNVVAPAGAKGFVESKALRRATQAEIDGAKTSGGLVDGVAIAPSGNGISPSGVDLTNTPNAKPDSKPETKPTTTPETKTATKPATTTIPSDSVAPTRVTAAGGSNEAQVAPANPAQRAIGDIKQLEAAFAEVVKQPVMTAEFSELLVEYQRAVEAVPADKPSYKKQLQQRVDYLNLRKEYQASMLAAEEARKGDDATQKALRSAVADLEATRIYTIIGTLQPSTVYDGTRLPRMYRVQSVGDANARTLGYITPEKDLNLDTKIGQVVGIVGEAQLDPGLRLNVIKPVRVDILKPGQTTTPPATPTTDTPPTELNK